MKLIVEKLSIEGVHIHTGSGMPSLASALFAALMPAGDDPEPCVGGATAGPISTANITAHERPAIGEYWPGQGGIYIGARLIDGAVHHVVIAEGGTTRDLKRQNFQAAQSVQFGEIAGHSDWHAGDQEDLMLAYINAREHFEQQGMDSIYWSRSEHHGWPWAVGFEHGLVGSSNRYDEFRVRPVRSFPDSAL